MKETLSLNAVQMAILLILVEGHFIDYVDKQIKKKQLPEGSEEKAIIEFNDKDDLADFKDYLERAITNEDFADHKGTIEEIIALADTSLAPKKIKLSKIQMAILMVMQTTINFPGETEDFIGDFTPIQLLETEEITLNLEASDKEEFVNAVNDNAGNFPDHEKEINGIISAVAEAFGEDVAADAEEKTE